MSAPLVVAALPGQLDVEALRRDSPGTLARVHLNAAGASLMPRPVTQALRAQHEAESIEGGYDAGYLAEALVERFYSDLARLLHAQPQDLAFVDSGSRAWAMALAALPFEPGSRLLFADSEYQGNWVAARWLAQQRGWQLEVVEQTGDADTDVARFVARLDDRVRLVSAVHVPSNNGIVTPVEQLGAALRQQAPNVVYLVDACQSIGQCRVDVTRMHADLLVGTGRKYLRGPRGSAFLYASPRVVERLRPQFLDTFSASESERLQPLASARCFETWECSVASKLGLGVAANYLLGLDCDAAWARIAAMADALRRRLAALRGVRLLDLEAGRGSGLVTFQVVGREARPTWQALTQAGFRLDTCQIRGTLLAKRLPNLEGALRASVHYYTTEQELDSFSRALAKLSNEGK